MRKINLLVVAALAITVSHPVLAQSIFEAGSVDAMSVGLGAGLAASLGRGAVVGRTYQSAADAQMSAAQALQLQSRAIEQYIKLGCQFQAKKEWQNAEKSFRYVLKVSALRDGPGSPKMVPTLQHLVGVSQAQGNLYDAIGFQERIVNFAKYQKVPDPASVVNSEIALSNLYLQKEDYRGAESVLRESYDLSQSSKAISDEKRSVTTHAYAQLLRKLKKDELANHIEKGSASSTQLTPPAQSTEFKTTSQQNITAPVASAPVVAAPDPGSSAPPTAGLTGTEITAEAPPSKPAINGH